MDWKEKYRMTLTERVDSGFGLGLRKLVGEKKENPLYKKKKTRPLVHGRKSKGGGRYRTLKS